jgi:transcriptional regulator with GAF, ATPase, and Fis domain
MDNGANEDSAERFEIGSQRRRVSDAGSETGSDDAGIDGGIDRSARLKETLRRKTRQLERDVLVRVLRETGGNEAQAARMLEMDDDTIHGKLRQYGIHQR